MLRAKILGSTPEAWFGRSLRTVSDGDMWRWWAIRKVAEYLEAKDRKPRG